MPKVYLSKEALDRTELLQFGSTARYKLNYTFKENFTNDQLEILENNLESQFDRSIRALSPNDGRDRLLRVLNFLTNFLSMVSLISFFLGLVGLIYLYSGYLRKHQNDIKVLSDIGVSKKNLIYTYLLHLFVLISISSIIVFSFIAVSAQFIAPILERYIDFSFDFTLDYFFFVKSAIILFVLSFKYWFTFIIAITSKGKKKFYKNDN